MSHCTHGVRQPTQSTGSTIEQRNCTHTFTFRMLQASQAFRSLVRWSMERERMQSAFPCFAIAPIRLKFCPESHYKLHSRGERWGRDFVKSVRCGESAGAIVCSQEEEGVQVSLLACRFPCRLLRRVVTKGVWMSEF